MDFSSINWWAVLVSIVVSMVSGSIWYHPKVFFNTWWAVVGKGEQPGMENMGMTWALTILAGAVQAVFVALFVHAVGSLSGGATLVSGMTVGFLLWLGIVAPTSLVNKLFAGHGLKIWAIEVGNHLVNFLAFGAIMGAWH